MRFLAGVLWVFVAVSTANAQQLLLIQRTLAENPTNESSDCVQVESDGSYHFEHTPMSLGQPGHHQIHVGKLSDEEMKQLQQMLDDPALQSLTTPKPDKGFMAADFDMLWVTINRGNDRQILFFESAAGANRVSGGDRYPSLYQTPTMKPLLNWYKQITKRKDDIDKTAAPTCSLKVKRY